MADFSNFEVTSDGSMVRVDMTDEALRKNDPAGKFVSLNQALILEAQGVCKIRRKSVTTSMEVIHKAVPKGRSMVEHLDQALVDSYGRFGIYKSSDAILGEKAGKWRVVSSREKEDLRKANPEVALYQVPKDLYGRKENETKGVKKKRVAWVMDDFIVGGAELSSYLVVKVGVDCGYLINPVTPSMDSPVMEAVFGWSDAVIVNNIWGFSPQQMRVLLKTIYSDRKPYVKYEHDHREFQRPEFSRKLFQNSRLNVFLSPMHLKNHREVLGCEGIALPLAIDVDLFKPVEGVERKKNAAVVCNVRNFKKWENLQKYVDEHQEIEFTVMARDPVIRGKNVKAHEKVPHEKMPGLYSGFEYVVHILDGWGAGERVVWEACLCGCKVVANGGVGHASWKKEFVDSPDLREWLRQAPCEFWKEVEKKALC